MEQKITNSNNFTKLLVNSLKNKKSWFFISTIIIFITVILIPYILKVNGESFIIFGVVEVFIMVFLNCLVDNSFLHSDSKLSYYKSKPLSFKKQINIHIISNVIFTAFLLVLIAMSSPFHDKFDITEKIFKVIIPWLLVGIVLTSLSSILTGNTIMAGLMTIFNFALPALIYLIIMFVFTILEGIVIGFSANVLMDSLTKTVYKLEYIYFFEYVDKSVDFIYFIILITFIIAIYIIANICLKRRKNENTDNLIVSDGYKYFVSVLASLIIPATFAMMLYGEVIWSKLLVSILLSVLSYYIIIAVLERTFKISRLSIKLFVYSMSIFMFLCGGTIFIANHYKDYVPDIEDVNMTYFGTDSWAIGQISNKDYESEEYIDIIEKMGNRNLLLLTEKESIKNSIDLHEEILINQSYISDDEYYYNNFIIAYWLKDGRFIIRDYKLNRDNNDYKNHQKDLIASKIINSQEYKEKRFNYLYDEDYYKNKNIYANIQNAYNGESIENNFDTEKLRENLKKDIDKLLLKEENSFLNLLYSEIRYEKFMDDDYKNNYFIEFIDEYNDDVKYIGQFTINESYENTMKYLGLKN